MSDVVVIHESVVSKQDYKSVSHDLLSFFLTCDLITMSLTLGK